MRKIYIEDKTKAFLIFTLGVIAGTVCVNQAGKQAIENISIFSYLAGTALTTVKGNGIDQLLYILISRLPLLLLIWILLMTGLGRLFLYGYLFYYSMAAGIVLSAETLLYGAKGMLLFLLSLFPHYLLYLAGFYILWSRGADFYQLLAPPQKPSTTELSVETDIKAAPIGLSFHIKTLGLMLIYFAAGAAMETYISPRFITLVMDFFGN